MTGLLSTSPGLSSLSYAERKRQTNARETTQLRAYCLTVYSALLPVGVFLHDLNLTYHWTELMRLLGEILRLPRHQGYQRLAELLEKRHETLDPDLIPLVYVALRQQRFWHMFLSAARFFDRVCVSLTRAARVQLFTAFLVTRCAQRYEVVQTLVALIPDSCWPTHQVEPALHRSETLEVSARLASWRSSNDQESVSCHDAWLLRLFKQRLCLTLDASVMERASSCAREILEEEEGSGLQRVA